MQPKAALRNGQPAPAQARSGWIMPFVFRTAGPSSQLIWTAVRFRREFAATPTHRYLTYTPILACDLAGNIHGLEQVRKPTRRCLHENNSCVGGHGVRPFNVECSFLRPAAIGARLPPGCEYLLETSVRSGAGGQTECARKDIQVVFRGRIVECVNDGNDAESTRRGKVVYGTDGCRSFP